MIRINIPGFNNSDSGGPRWGDAQIIDDGTNYVVIDGYCGTGKNKLIRRLKSIGCKNPYLYISHAHGDHDEGIMAILKDSYFSPLGLGCYDPESLKGGLGNSEIKDDYNYLKSIIAKAKARKVPVKYLEHGDKVVHGDIEFEVYRRQPNFTGNANDPHGWVFMNDGSLCFYFPALRYWTSGDGPQEIYTLCKAVGAAPVWFKIPHHGNNCPADQAAGMKSLGAKFCWDNDYNTSYTDFLKYGRRRCIEAGIKHIGIHGDINAIFFRGRAVIYKDASVFRYDCPYNGGPDLNGADDAIVKAVLAGDAGNGNSRITYLLDHGYNPILVQRAVNAALNPEPAKTEEPEPVKEPEATAEKIELFGIDVGYSQGRIDWERAAGSIDFAILECGYGQDQTNQDDTQFARNAAECERLGIPYGIYLYSYAKNTTRAIGEANHALRLAKGRQLSLPIYYDLEEKSIAGAAAGNMSAFGLVIEKAGYWCGLYSGEYYYNTNLNGINRFTKWIARYNSNNGKKGTKPNVSNVTIWQYSSKGRIPGINGNVDINVMYGDDLIKSVTGKDYIQAARDVWAGKYGDDAERTDKLKAAGFDHRIVQHFVNRLAN